MVQQQVQVQVRKPVLEQAQEEVQKLVLVLVQKPELRPAVQRSATR